MSSVTGVELGPDYCVLVRARQSGPAIEVTALRIFDHLEWPTELAVQAGQLRDARRELSLPRRAVVVAWTAGRASNEPNPETLLTAAGFTVQSVLSPVDALTLLARSRPRLEEEAPTAWLSINHHGVAMSVLRDASMLYSREFAWRIQASEQRVQAHLLRRYLYVAQLMPELRKAREAVEQQHGVGIGRAIACGNVPDLRSLTMRLIDELDFEFETLDSTDGYKASGPVAAALAQTTSSLRLASVAAAFRSEAGTGHSGRWAAVAAALTLAAGAAWWAFTIWAASPAMAPSAPAAPTAIAVQTEQPAAPVATSPPPATPPAEPSRPQPSIGTQGADRSDGGTIQPKREPLPSVGGVLISADRRLAVIDGAVVGIGDRVGTRTVADIEANAVVLREPSGNEIRLPIRGRTGGGG